MQFFTMWLIKHWHKFPRGCTVYFLGDTKTQLAMVLSNLIYLDLFWAGPGLDISRDLFRCIWFCDFHRADPSTADAFRTASSHVCLLFSLFGWDSFHIMKHLAPAMMGSFSSQCQETDIPEAVQYVFVIFCFRMGCIWTRLSHSTEFIRGPNR